MLDSLAACLASERYEVITASNGMDAFELWNSHRPNLLCLDVMMSILDGYEMCRMVRAIDPQVPVLFLSAKNEEIDVVVAFQLGAYDFIRKPFGKHELLARIRAVFRRANSVPGKSHSFTMRDLTVWPTELRAERDGVSFDLSPRGIKILELLHERAGQVVDRDTILNICWGIDYFPESRTLD